MMRWGKILALLVIIASAAWVLGHSHAALATSTPAWQAQGNYSNYPSPTSCSQSSNYSYPGYNSDNHCYWNPVPIALSAESISNSAYTTLSEFCTSQQTSGCAGRSVQYRAPSSAVYVTTGTPVQIDWSCLPSQTVSFWVWTSTSYDAFGNPQLHGYWATYVLSYTNSVTLTRSTGGTVYSGSSLYGSVSETPASDTTYTLSCGSYTRTIDIKIVPSFTSPLTVSLTADNTSVPTNSSANLTYSAQNVRSGGTCTLTGTGVSISRSMGTSNFSYTGANQSWTAPTGLTGATIKLWGAGGARYNNISTSPGGGGGYTIANLVSSAGQIYTIIVGQGGSTGGATATYGGGGARGGSSTYPSSGGGRTAIRDSSGNELITAGGGGGGAVVAGGGGGTTGGPSSQYNGQNPVSGGSQTAGGGPTASAGTYGSQFTGATGDPTYGSGGGGGWYGGGSAAYAGGSGGSGHCDASLPFCALVGAGTGSGAQTNDADYPGGTVASGNGSGNGYAMIMGTFSGTTATPALSNATTYTFSCTAGGVSTSTQVTITTQAPTCSNGLDYPTYGPSCNCPAGQMQSGTTCVPQDVCSNMPGAQSSAPANCTANADGTCSANSGYVISGSSCIPATPTGSISSFTANPTRARKGSIISLAWSTTNINSCSLVAIPGGTISTATNSSGTNFTINQRTVFTLSCIDTVGATETAPAVTVPIVPTFFEQ